MKNPISWFEIYVQDMPRAKAFYEAVLQVELTSLVNPNPENGNMEMWAFPANMEQYGVSGSLVKMEGVPPLANGVGTMVYFGCEDCAVEAARVAENGGKIFKEKTAIGEYGFIALFNDTEGNMVGLHSMA